MNKEIETVELLTEDELALKKIYISEDDTFIVFLVIIIITLTAWLINRLINFVPEFMKSFVRKSKDSSALDPSLDKSEFGFKTLIDKWFKY